MSGLPRIKRDVECTFDLILKNLAFAPKRYVFPVTSNMFMFFSKPIFLFYKFRSWPIVCCETRYRKSTLNYGCCCNGRESDKTSTITWAVSAIMSLILYKCFRTKGKDIFQLTNAFSRSISVTFSYCCSSTSVD